MYTVAASTLATTRGVEVWSVYSLPREEHVAFAMIGGDLSLTIVPDVGTELDVEDMELALEDLLFNSRNHVGGRTPARLTPPATGPTPHRDGDPAAASFLALPAIAAR